ncbi:MAG: LD-carboxypeptidase [Bacteroidetes bacterium]|nr:LD-carboxypeptidase [Bacteroidota bacterium]
MNPKPCQPGDLIALVCPARKMSAADLESAKALLESWGFRVRLGSSVGAEDHQFGGSDAVRAADLMTQFRDPEVRAILCVRGGYGSARLLLHLDPFVFINHPKWLVGFSDITALHTAWWNLTGLPSIHAPMPSLFQKTSPNSMQALQLAFGGHFANVHSPPHPLNREGRAEGILLGGNLSVLYSLRGTPYFPKLPDQWPAQSSPSTKKVILFIEDLDEYLYHIDRMVLNLELSGLLDQIAGLIVGGMTGMRDNEIPFGKSAEEIIRERMGTRRVPIAFGFLAGHQPDNVPLALGKKVTLSVGPEESYLEYGHA